MTYSYQYAKRHGYRSVLYNPYRFRYRLENNGTFSAEVPSRLGGIRSWRRLADGGAEYVPGLGLAAFDLAALYNRYDAIVRRQEALNQHEALGFFI